MPTLHTHLLSRLVASGFIRGLGLKLRVYKGFIRFGGFDSHARTSRHYQRVIKGY